MNTEPQTYLHIYGDRVNVCETATGRVVCGFDMHELIAQAWGAACYVRPGWFPVAVSLVSILLAALIMYEDKITAAIAALTESIGKLKALKMPNDRAEPAPKARGNT